MEVIIQPTAEKVTDLAARLFASVIQNQPNAVLGLATGSTPLLLYRKLIAKKLDWRQITTFNLDEYVNISPEHPQSYHHFMRESLFQHINIAAKNINIPDGVAKDIPKFCDRYEKKILSAGGIDLQLLGIGTDGHIGFNEPTSSMASRTRFKTLTEQTRKDNARFFGDWKKVPHHVITMGIRTIMDARHCVLLAFGKNKAHAIAAMIEGPITSMNPGSALQLHPKVTVFLDEAAATGLKLKDYYRLTFDKKPCWQNI
jgi:glucosamine-6-phosphate deaminase